MSSKKKNNKTKREYDWASKTKKTFDDVTRIKMTWSAYEWIVRKINRLRIKIAYIMSKLKFKGSSIIVVKPYGKCLAVFIVRGVGNRA